MGDNPILEGWDGGRQSGFSYKDQRDGLIACVGSGAHLWGVRGYGDPVMSYRGAKAPISGGTEPSRSPRLLQDVRNRLRLKHYSLRTEQVYLYWIRRYIRECGMKHPRELDGVAVEAFLTRLAVRDRVAASTQNQALSALLYLYREVLGIDLPWMENVVRAKRPQRLPVVLSKGEVAALLREVSGREWLMTGLHIREWLAVDGVHPLADQGCAS